MVKNQFTYFTDTIIHSSLPELGYAWMVIGKQNCEKFF